MTAVAVWTLAAMGWAGLARAEKGRPAADPAQEWGYLGEGTFPWHEAYYVGEVGGAAIQLRLQILKEDAGPARGEYYYEKRGTPLDLAGRFDSGQLALKEQVDGKTTGTFAGHFEANARELKLTWSSADGKRRLPVRLTKVAEQNISSKQYGNRCSAECSAPRLIHRGLLACLVDRKLNSSAELATGDMTLECDGILPDDLEPPWNTEIRSRITYFSPEIISIASTSYAYTGGAHGNYAETGETYVTADGKLRQLRLGDLFRTGSAYVARLSDACMASLRKQGALWIRDGSVTRFKEEDISEFTVSPQGVSIHFSPYEVGCFAEGSYMVTIPWKDLRDILGPLPEINKLAALTAGPIPPEPKPAAKPAAKPAVKPPVKPAAKPVAKPAAPVGKPGAGRAAAAKPTVKITASTPRKP